MRVADHEPQAWFLLEEGGAYYLDARAERGAVEYGVLLRLTPEERAAYAAEGRPYLQALAAHVAYAADAYAGRNLHQELGAVVTLAVQAWRRSRGL